MQKIRYCTIRCNTFFVDIILCKNYSLLYFSTSLRMDFAFFVHLASDRHAQLPPSVYGMFMRALVGRFKKSCMGIITVSAAEENSRSIISATILSS